MRIFLLLLGIALGTFSCSSTKTISDRTPGVANDTIRIENDSLEYRIIIVEPGFESWLISQPPRGYYSQNYLEDKNRIFVTEYNSRVLQRGRYPLNLYEEQINYDPQTDYGYEVNYLLYNYFVFFQNKYNQYFTGGRK